MTAEPALRQNMTADEFFAWAETWEDTERYELIDGVPVRMQAEKISHAERKASAWLALRTALQSAGLADCRAFPDGVSVRVGERTVREPDAVVHCGPYDADKMFAPNPIVVVEILSPSTARTDFERKLIDYFAVPSMLHYLIVLGDEGRVIHHRRRSAETVIETIILGREAVIDLSPPGFSVTVEELLTA